LIITAAHLTALDANMSVRIAGMVLPAKVLKQGSSEDVDLSLLLVDEQKLPTPSLESERGVCDSKFIGRGSADRRKYSASARRVRTLLAPKSQVIANIE
jgi:hypothetical protein